MMKLPKIDWPQTALVLGLAAIGVVALIYAPAEYHAPIGGLLTLVVGALRSIFRPSDPTPSALPLVLALVLASSLTGCAPTTLQLHARVYAFAAVTVEVSHASLVRACTVLRDDCAGEPACLESARASCTDAATAQDAARDAVDLYDRIIVAASLAGGDAGVMAQVLQALDLAVTAWGALGRTLGVLGAPLPDLPAWASALLASAVPGGAT